MDGRALSMDEVNRIADLESREVLLAKMAGAMKANLSKAAGLFNAPASQVARLAAALQEKKPPKKPRSGCSDLPQKHHPPAKKLKKTRKDHHGQAVH